MKLIKRQISKYLKKEVKKSPAIAILGPRQSGKTTVARMTFPDYEYVSLEELDNREFAIKDPRGFLAEYDNKPGVIFDEIQNTPDLFSYIQGKIDLNYRPGFYILTGSQNFLLTQSISQTLAGRISLHTLLPLSIQELKDADLLPDDSSEVIFKGFYPIIYSKNFDPEKWYADYIKNYLEKDVRNILNISDLITFKRFLKVCASSIGQLVNYSALANDCGVSYNTIKSWLSVLEASYIIYPLQPHYKNFKKRLVKSPKLYFYDTGLACSLLDLDNANQVKTHYARGALFESMIISDLFKDFYNRDKNPSIYFWRDNTGHEVDCLIEKADKLYPIEIKSSQTLNYHFFNTLEFWNNLSKNPNERSYVVYSGQENQKRSLGSFVSWKNTSMIIDQIDSE